jgi:hypothetical protein
MEPKGSLPHSRQPATSHNLSQLNPVPALPTDFFNIHFNSILTYTARSSNLTEKITIFITAAVDAFNLLQHVDVNNNRFP